MKGMFEKSKDITWLNTTVKIKSAVSAENKDQLQAMADELCQEYIAQSPEAANKNDLTLFSVSDMVCMWLHPTTERRTTV